MKILKDDYLPDQLKTELSDLGFDGSVTVQARQTLEETRWILKLAGQYNFIKGVVGWLDLCSPWIEEQLDEFSKNSKLRGVRHVIHDEKDDDFMLRKDFLKGISCLEKFGLSYDLLIFPSHLPNTIRFVAQFPGQVFILDHIAKPCIKERRISGWKEDIEKLACYPNVYCKLSGILTEGDISNWKKEDFTPYLDIVLEAFGPDRLLIGSDWPVCLLAGDYRRVMEVVLDYLDPLSDAEKNKIMGSNAVNAYQLEF